jgi:hypothetical protein
LIAKVCDAFSYHVDVFSDTDRRLARAFFLTAGFLALRRLVDFALLTRRSPYGSPGVHFPDWLAAYFPLPEANCEGPLAGCRKTLSGCTTAKAPWRGVSQTEVAARSRPNGAPIDRLGEVYQQLDRRS